MSKLKIEQFCVGEVGTNCYFLIQEETGALLVVDPGDEAQRLADRIQKEQLKPAAILLTHGHFDHAMAADELAKKYRIKIYAQEQEKDTLEEPRYNLSGMLGRSDRYRADVYLKDEELLTLAGFSIRVLHTPGHTPGGCCYFLEQEGVLISGDTLFCQSIGRTDFPRGSMSALVRSIREKLLPLPDHTRVYPGHMEDTTIGQEKQTNPYL